MFVLNNSRRVVYLAKKGSTIGVACVPTIPLELEKEDWDASTKLLNVAEMIKSGELVTVGPVEAKQALEKSKLAIQEVE